MRRRIFRVQHRKQKKQKFEKKTSVKFKFHSNERHSCTFRSMPCEHQGKKWDRKQRVFALHAGKLNETEVTIQGKNHERIQYTVITWSASISHAINSVERRREYKCVKQMEKRKQTTVSDNAFVACDVSSVAFYSFAVLFDHFKRRENTYEISLSRIAHTRTIARTSINKRSRIRNASTGDNELLFQLTTIARVVKFNVKSKDNLVVRIVHPFNWRPIFLFFVIFSTWLWLSVSVLPI